MDCIRPPCLSTIYRICVVKSRCDLASTPIAFHLPVDLFVVVKIWILLLPCQTSLMLDNGRISLKLLGYGMEFLVCLAT